MFSSHKTKSFFDWRFLWSVVKRTSVGIFKDDLWGRSAEIAYDFMFSLFPALMFLAALLSKVVDMPATIDDPAILDEVTGALTTIGYPPAS